MPLQRSFLLLPVNTVISERETGRKQERSWMKRKASWNRSWKRSQEKQVSEVKYDPRSHQLKPGCRKCQTLSPVFQPVSGFGLVKCSACAVHHLLVLRSTHVLWSDTSSVTLVQTVCIRFCVPALLCVIVWMSCEFGHFNFLRENGVSFLGIYASGMSFIIIASSWVLPRVLASVHLVYGSDPVSM